jgi:AcrR family transcriptional regulator
MDEQAHKIDRRKERTQRLLRDALMELIVEKGYDAITILDITERANVARPTFYLHYDDKEDLLFQMMTEVYDDLSNSVDKQTTVHGLLPDGTPAEVIVFQHVKENVNFYRVMVLQPGVASFVNRARHYLADMFERHVNECFPGNTLSPELIQSVGHREAGALIGMVCWWLETGLQQTPEEMARLYYTSGHQGVWDTLTAGETEANVSLPSR